MIGGNFKSYTVMNRSTEIIKLKMLCNAQRHDTYLWTSCGPKHLVHYIFFLIKYLVDYTFIYHFLSFR